MTYFLRKYITPREVSEPRFFYLQTNFYIPDKDVEVQFKTGVPKGVMLHGGGG